MVGRHSFGRASRHDAVGRRRTIRSSTGRLITERERERERHSREGDSSSRLSVGKRTPRISVSVLPETTEA